MELRRAVLEDVPAVSRIHAVSWKEGYRGLVPPSYLDSLRTDFWVPGMEA